MRLAVRHRTEFRYSLAASQATSQLCLLPRDTPTQVVRAARLEIEPGPESVEQALDRFGNRIARFGTDRPHGRSIVTATSTVDTTDVPPPLPGSPPVARSRAALAKDRGVDMLLAEDCLLASRYVPAVPLADALIGELPPGDATVLEHAQALCTHIHRTFMYDPAFSTVATPLADVVEARKGVCQDFAHVAILVLRRLGVPARYVSGYLETLPPPGKPKLQGADASHAWFGVYVPGAGWFDFDPTNDKRPDGQYVTTAWGRDYGDVAPLRGIVYGGGKHRLRVEVDVDRIGGGPALALAPAAAPDTSPAAAPGAAR